MIRHGALLLLLLLSLPVVMACMLYVLALNLPWYLIQLWLRGAEKLAEPPGWAAMLFWWTRYLRTADETAEAVAEVARDVTDAVAPYPKTEAEKEPR